VPSYDDRTLALLPPSTTPGSSSFELSRLGHSSTPFDNNGMQMWRCWRSRGLWGRPGLGGRQSGIGRGGRDGRRRWEQRRGRLSAGLTRGSRSSSSAYVSLCIDAIALDSFRRTSLTDVLLMTFSAALANAATAPERSSRRRSERSPRLPPNLASSHSSVSGAQASCTGVGRYKGSEDARKGVFVLAREQVEGREGMVIEREACWVDGQSGLE
jgi:hypothetical protein